MWDLNPVRFRRGEEPRNDGGTDFLTTPGLFSSSERPSVRSRLLSLSSPSVGFPQLFHLFCCHLGEVTRENDASSCFRSLEKSFWQLLFSAELKHSSAVEAALLAHMAG